MTAEKPIVLVLEDESLLLASITTKLEKSGLVPVSVSGVDQALQYLKTAPRPPQVIWVDYYLGEGQTGLDFMKALHANQALALIPVIVVSNTATKEKVDQMMALGARKYFLKAEHLLGDIIDFIWTLID